MQGDPSLPQPAHSPAPRAGDDALYSRQMERVLRKRVLRSLQAVATLWEADIEERLPPRSPFAPPLRRGPPGGE